MSSRWKNENEGGDLQLTLLPLFCCYRLDLVYASLKVIQAGIISSRKVNSS